MSPDTQQNLFYTIFFIILHNYEALFYTAGIIISCILTYRQPTRSRLFIMWGFIILLFVFEYNKHIVEGLKEQTVNSLITVRQSARIEHTINVILGKAIPLFFPLIGWAFIMGGIVKEWFIHKLKK